MADGTKKYGRNEAKCRIYAQSFRRFNNKKKKIAKSNGKLALSRYERGEKHSKRYRLRQK